jgi:fatty-acyl-CoA synthase
MDETAVRRSDLELRHPSWTPMSLASRFDTVAAEYGDRPYVMTDARNYSYAEIQDWSRRIARALIAVGVQAGDHIAMVIDNRPEFVPVKLAVARVGAVAVPLNYAYRARDLAAALSKSEASVLLTIDKSVATDFLGVLDGLVPGWEQGVDSPELPRLRRVVVVPSGVREGALDLDGLIALGERGGEWDDELRTRENAVDPEGVCDLVFTSGTTGHAIGVTLTHDMILRSAYGSAYTRAFTDGWRIGFSLPLYHVFGYIEGLLSTLFVGGAIVPHAIFNPRTTLEAIERHKVNEVLFVPTMTTAVLDQAAKQSYDLSSLESVFSAAAPAPVHLWERVQRDLRPRSVATGYGQTEVSAATTLTQPGDPLAVVAGTVGCAKLGGVAATEGMNGRLAEYRTVDPFTGAPLPAGQEGELSVRGPIVTRSYYNEPERTAELIDAEGWLRTGDLGCIRPDGYLELTGRSSELYKVGGELVAPKEIEDLLTDHAAVAQAFVAGVDDERMGQVGWAWVVLVEGAEVSARELIHYLAGQLAPFKVPHEIRFLSVEELPMTTTGKVQKYELIASRGAVSTAG